jgi:tetratricopeptide (TPR) repeat protein
MSDKRLQENSEVTKKVEEQKENIIQQQDDKVSNEAVEAVNMVIDIIALLKEKKKDEAIAAIEKVLGKLEVLIAKNPELALIPVDVKEQVVDFPGTIADVEAAKKAVKELIDEGEVQAARDIMLALASELDIYITALPLATYPEALKVIIPLIEQEKYDEAIALLAKVLETLVLEKMVIPLPILRAQQTIERASELTKENDNADKEELKALLAYAKEQLLLAQALGYGKVSEDYKPLLEEIEKIEKALGEESEGTKGIFEELKAKLGTFMKSFDKKKEPTKMPKAE